MADGVYCLNCGSIEEIRYRTRITEYYRVDSVTNSGQAIIGKLSGSVAENKEKDMIVCLGCDSIWNPRHYIKKKKELEGMQGKKEEGAIRG